VTAPFDLGPLIRLWTTRADSVVDAGATDPGFHYAPAPPTDVQHPAGSRRHEPGLTLTPIPARGALVRLTGRVGSEATVFDALGRPVMRQRLAHTEAGASLDISRLSAGVYLVETGSEPATSRGRPVIQR